MLLLHLLVYRPITVFLLEFPFTEISTNSCHSKEISYICKGEYEDNSSLTTTHLLTHTLSELAKRLST